MLTNLADCEPVLAIKRQSNETKVISQWDVKDEAYDVFDSKNTDIPAIQGYKLFLTTQTTDI